MSLCRSCGAEIRWATTFAGESMPVDAHPAADGTVRLWQDGPFLRADVRGATIDLLDPTDDGVRHMPHWATCPHADSWRSP